jgi:hypothetical protein
VRIFISHASLDKPLIDAFVDLLQTGLNISTKDIFCTSLEGQGITQGTYFVPFIREQLKDAGFLIAVISPAYLESTFCVCELGAAWVIEEQQFFPILVPPLNYADLKAVLLGVQSGQINDKNLLNALRDRLEQVSISQSVSTGRWEQKRDEFINAFSRIQKELSGSTNVPFERYSELENKYEYSQQALEEKNALIDEQKKLIEELKLCKDKDQVGAVIHSKSKPWEKFESLVQAINQAGSKIPPVVLETLFHERSGRTWNPSHSDGKWESIEAAEQDAYLDTNDGQVSIRQHTRTNRVKEALSQLTDFRNSEESEQVYERFESEHDYPLAMNNKEFWEEYLGL